MCHPRTGDNNQLHQKHIFRSEESVLCRVSRKENETIHHIISGCDALASTKYRERHDNVCKYIHALLRNKRDIDNQMTPWYQHQPRSVVENIWVKILWNFQIQTDHHPRHIKPDIIVIDQINKEANIIDVAIPNYSETPRKDTKLHGSIHRNKNIVVSNYSDHHWYHR